MNKVAIGKPTGEGTASLEKALDVLQAIGSLPQGISQKQLAEQTGLPHTTLYRMLATLIERGMIRRDPVGKVYRLGFSYLEMVRNAYLVPDLVVAASNELRALRDLSGETTYLAVLDGDQVLSIERCDGAHTARSSASLGQNKPVYCTGQGKAILSALDDRSREDILKGVVLEPLTPLTITDRRRLRTELQISRSRGYAILFGRRQRRPPHSHNTADTFGTLLSGHPLHQCPALIVGEMRAAKGHQLDLAITAVELLPGPQEISPT